MTLSYITQAQRVRPKILLLKKIIIVNYQNNFKEKNETSFKSLLKIDNKILIYLMFKIDNRILI